MFDLRQIEQDSIVICPSSINKNILIEKGAQAPFLKMKLISKQQLLENVYFSYDEEAVAFLRKKGYSYSNCNEILSNLVNIKPENDKLTLLKHIYDELFKNYLLKFNTYYKNLFINKKVYIYRYSKMDQEIINALNKINVDYTYLEDEDTKYTHKVINFKTRSDELDYVFTQIGELLSNGVSINNIKFFKLPSEYELEVIKYCNKYNFKIENVEKMNLASSPIYHLFMENLKSNNVEEAFRITSESIKEDRYYALGRIVEVATALNEIDIDKEEYIKHFDFLAKRKNLKNVDYDNEITFVDENTIISEDDHIFMLGFSLGSYPPISKDTDFLSDEEKTIVGYNTSVVVNQISKENITRFIQSTKNLTITYKEKVGKDIFFKSLLVNELKLEEEQGKLGNVRYSRNATENEMCAIYDDYHNFGIISKYLNALSENEISYRSYSHLFKPSACFQNKEFLKLSYSSINDYNVCPFKYFVRRVLKANVFEDSFSTSLGNYYHKLLEDSLNKEIDLNNYTDLFNSYFKTNKDIFFANNLISQFYKVKEKNDEFLKVTKFTHLLEEQKKVIKFDSKTILEGKIDKTMINEEDKELVIVDYKTGDFSFDKRKVEFGLNLQLPIYTLLLADGFEDYKLGGIYIQNILIDENEGEKANYYLTGLTLLDDELVNHLDFTNNDSAFITGVKRTKNGYLKSSSHFITEVDLDNLKVDTRDQIELTIDNIRRGNFPIAPKLTDDFNSPCSLCPCIDICFKDYKDNVYIRLKKDEEEEQ